MLSSAREIRIQDFVVCPSVNRIVGKNGYSRVTPKAMDVLCTLATSRGSMVTRRELVETHWPDSLGADDSLAHVIKELRSALGDDGKSQKVIETIRKRGYRLVSDSYRPHRVHMTPAVVLSVGFALIIGLLLALGRNDDAIDLVPVTNDSGIEWSASLSADGSRVAYVTQDTGNKRFTLVAKTVSNNAIIREVVSQDFGYYSPRFSPDGGQLAFVRLGSDGCEVFITDLSNGSLRRVSHCPTGFLSPIDWSPDGKYIASSRLDTQDGKRSVGLQLTSLDTGDHRTLTTPPRGFYDVRPRFSPDGDTVAFVRRDFGNTHDRRIYVIDFLGGTPRPLTDRSWEVHGLDWFPDGSALVFASDTEGRAGLWQLDYLTGHAQFLGLSDSRFPAVARKSGRLVFESWPDMDSWITRLTLRGDQAPQIFHNPTRNNFHPAVSPDGSRIAFTSRQSGFSAVWITDQKGEQAFQLTCPPGNDCELPAWAPDGKSILATVSNAAGSRLYVIDLESNLASRLAEAGDQVRGAAWHPDLTKVFYSSNDVDGWQIRMLDIVNRTVETVTSDSGVYPKTIDGQWIYYVKPGQYGIYRISQADKKEEPVVADLHFTHWGSWDLTAEALYYARFPDEVLRVDLNTLASVTVATAQPVTYEPGLSASKDGQYVLVTSKPSRQVDIFLVDLWALARHRSRLTQTDLIKPAAT